MAAFYFQVYNTATQMNLDFVKLNFESLAEARLFRDKLREEYGKTGHHEVRMFLEIYPDEQQEDDIEEEFDFDELQEEE